MSSVRSCHQLLKGHSDLNIRLASSPPKEQNDFILPYLCVCEPFLTAAASAAAPTTPAKTSPVYDESYALTATSISGPSLLTVTSPVSVGPSSPDDANGLQQEVLSESFSRTVKDWEKVRQSRAKYRSHVVAPQADNQLTDNTSITIKSSKSPSIGSSGGNKASRSKSRDRDKSRHRAEKELTKINRRQLKLEDELRRLFKAKAKLEAQLETSWTSVGSDRETSSSSGLRQTRAETSPPSVGTANDFDDYSMELFDSTNADEDVELGVSAAARTSDDYWSCSQVDQSGSQHARSKSSKVRRSPLIIGPKTMQRQASLSTPLSPSNMAMTSMDGLLPTATTVTTVGIRSRRSSEVISTVTASIPVGDGTIGASSAEYQQQKNYTE